MDRNKLCMWCTRFFQCNLLRVANVAKCQSFIMDRELRVDVLYACGGRVETNKKEEAR